MFSIKPGYSSPYGAYEHDGGINFALFSKNAIEVTLCLFQPHSQTIIAEIALNPYENKTGDVWHVFIKDPPLDFSYAFKIHGVNDQNHKNRFDSNALLLDPYAKAVNTPIKWGSETAYQPFGTVFKEDAFEWDVRKFPVIPMHELIIYEMHVRGFTWYPTSLVTNPGTFLGIIEKIPYLKELGINTIELLPIQEFNEQENININPVTKERLFNYWGYSSVNFFSPMNRYASSNESNASILEFKKMVNELHNNGIEVILDIVFNHTSEGNHLGPTISYRGIDNSIYYLLNREGYYLNFTGCGNTLNCNHPIVRELIIDCLRYWVCEMHVDGFRFDLATILTRNPQGKPLDCPPLVEAITHDPILAQTKLIAEPWDAVGMYQVGAFFPQERRWAEWNGKYRDCVRRFIKGDFWVKNEFATRVCGSSDLYGSNRYPYHSINFITAHDGFTLADLVSFNEKHNEANGEGNQDGNNTNDSWNCGFEGFTENPEVNALRQRQMRNFHIALMVSQGVPMIQMGDEYGHTKKGNNNTWCQDNELSWFLWDKLENDITGYQRFFRLMIQFRKLHRLLRRPTFLTEKDILWHGAKPLKPNWEDSCRFLGFSLIDHESHEDLYIAFNPQGNSFSIELPELRDGFEWVEIVNTGKDTPNDIIDKEHWFRGDGVLKGANRKKGHGKKHNDLKFNLSSYSAVIFKALKAFKIK